MRRDLSIPELRQALDAAEARMVERFIAGVPLRQLREEEGIAWWTQHRILMRRMGEGRYRAVVRRNVLERARRSAITRGQRPWTAEEDAIVRAEYGRGRAAAIAERLDRSINAVRNRGYVLGVARTTVRTDPKFEAFVIARHAEGWSDAEIADARGLRHRQSVAAARRRNGLAVNTGNPRQRARVAARTRAQCRAAGVDSLAYYRAKKLAEASEKMGWPAGLLWRQAQILDALYTRGPMTRRQIAEAVGMPWKGSCGSLAGNCAGGSYLAGLMRRGLVIRLNRAVPMGGKGHNVSLYTLPLWVQRRERDGTQQARRHADAAGA